MKRIQLVLVGLALLMALFITGFSFANKNVSSQHFMDSQQNNSQNMNGNTNKKSKKNKNANSSNMMNTEPTMTPTP